MNLQRLKYFDAISRLTSFRAAAESLGVSQPALTRQIQILEREFGCALFQRGRRSVSLTAAGSFLQARLPSLFTECDYIKNETKRRGSETVNRLSIGVLQSLLDVVFPRALLAWRRRHGEMRIAVYGFRTEQIIEMIRGGQQELGIIGSVHPHVRLASRPLFTEPIVAVYPLGHRLSRRQAIEPMDLFREPLVTFPQGFMLRSMVEELGKRHNVTPQIAAEVESIGAIKALVQAGLGLTLLPACATVGAGPEGLLGASAVADAELRRTVFLVHRSDSRLPPPAQRLGDCIREAGEAILAQSAVHLRKG